MCYWAFAMGYPGAIEMLYAFNTLVPFLKFQVLYFWHSKTELGKCIISTHDKEKKTKNLGNFSLYFCTSSMHQIQ